MRSTLLCFLFILYACNGANDGFVLIKVDYQENGKLISAKYFRSLKDSEVNLIINYWDNGNIMSKSFYKNQIKIGRWEFYSMSGKLREVLIFDNNKLQQKMIYE